MIDAAAKCNFDGHGYLDARGLFDAEETRLLRDHFMRLREAGDYPGDVVGVDPSSDDPLKRYPRMIHMHRWDRVALDWLLEPRLARCAAVGGGGSPFFNAPAPGADLLPAHIFDVTFIGAAPGSGAALSWILFLIILAATLLLFATGRFWVFYGSD